MFQQIKSHPWAQALKRRIVFRLSRALGLREIEERLRALEASNSENIYGKAYWHVGLPVIEQRFREIDEALFELKQQNRTEKPAPDNLQQP